MSERLGKIDERIEKLEALQEPLYTEKWELEEEKEKIHAQMVKDIALEQEWILCYNERFKKFYLELRDYDPNDKVSDKIYKHTSGRYHDSFLFEGKDEDDPYETVKLHIDDGDVVIQFSNIEMFKKYRSLFKIDFSKMDEAKKKLQEKLDILREVKRDV